MNSCDAENPLKNFPFSVKCRGRGMIELSLPPSAALLHSLQDNKLSCSEYVGFSGP